MSNMKRNSFVQPIVFLLALLTLVSAGASLIAVGCLSAEGDPTETFPQSELFRRLIPDLGYAAWALASGEENDRDAYERLLDPATTNYRYLVFDGKGALVAGTAEPMAYNDASALGTESRYEADEAKALRVVSLVDADFSIDDDLRASFNVYRTLCKSRTAIKIIGAAAVLASIWLCGLLAASARHNDLPLRGIHRIPSDVLLFLALALGAFVSLVALVAVDAAPLAAAFGWVLFVLFAGAALFLTVLTSFARRIGRGVLLSNTLVARILRIGRS